jgi:hypothetical protein
MKPRNVLFIVLALLLLFIVGQNWAVISQSTKLKFIFIEVNAPLGVLLVLIAGAILAVDFIVHSLNKLSWARDRRELTAQIEKQRLLADQAEESRIRELREVLERETAAIRAQLEVLIRR